MAENRTECWACGASAKCEIHHVAPRQFGGLDNPENLVPLCSNCHDVVTHGFSHPGNMGLMMKALFQEATEANREAKWALLMFSQIISLWAADPAGAHRFSKSVMTGLADSDMGQLNLLCTHEVKMNGGLFGYRHKHGRLVEDSGELEIVKMIRKLKLQSVKNHNILRALEKLGTRVDH